MSTYWPKPIEKDSLQDGDHILTYRHGGLYSHHGIYVAEERKVIHFDWRDHWYSHTGEAYNLCGQCGNNASRVRMSCVDCFLRFKLDHRGNAVSPVLHRFEYGKSQVYLLTHDLGTCSTQRSDGAEEVVRRAVEVYKIGTFAGIGKHWRLWNNCESFAYYCKTGKYTVGKQILRLIIVPTTVSASCCRHCCVGRDAGCTDQLKAM